MSLSHMTNEVKIKDAISKLKEIKGDPTILQPVSRYKRPLELAIESLTENRRKIIEETKKEVKKMCKSEVIEVIKGNYPISGQERLKKALDIAISEMKENSWTKTEDELPEETEKVIVSVKDDSGDSICEYTAVGWRLGDAWIVDDDIRRGVVAWKKMPKPYE